MANSHSEMSQHLPRYAIYYAPGPDEALWRFGSDILGYDAVSGLQSAPPVELENYADRWPAMTSEPRKYGFHATLKAPFYLASGCDEAKLMDAIRDFAAVASKAVCEGLKISTVGPFVALIPKGDETAINRLAFSIVEYFEPCRAPLSEVDIARRMASPLTQKQIRYLNRYGYPYVNDEFRFHMTLTNSLHQDDRQDIAHLLDHLSQDPLSKFNGFIDRICLFKQEDPAARFKIIASADLR